MSSSDGEFSLNVLSVLEPRVRQDLGRLFLAGLLFWSSLTALLPTLPLYVESLSGSTQQIGMVMGSFAIGLLLFRAQLGNLADRHSRKLVLMLGMAVVATAPLGYLLVHSVPWLMLIRAFHGISIAAFTTAYSALVVDYSPEQSRGELIGYMSLVNPIGVAIGPALGGFLAAGMGYPPLFLLSATLGLIGLVCVANLPDRSQETRSQSQQLKGQKEKFWGLLWEARMRIPAVVLLLIGLAFGAMSTFVPLFIKATQVPLNPGLFYTAAAIASFGVRLPTGRASDRYGRGLFITISLIFYTLAMLLLWSATTARAFILAAIFEGAGAGILIPMMAALLADRSHAHERGRTFGLCMAGFDLGMAIAGPSLGFVAEQVGYRSIFGLAAALTSLGIGVFLTCSSKDLRRSMKFALGQSQDIYALPRGI